MNLRNIANSVTRGINPNYDVILRVNTGYTINDYGEQVPSFTDSEINIQLQSLQTSDLQFLDLVQQQGTFIYAYTDANVFAQLRKDSKGNDKMIFSRYRDDKPSEWLVKQVVEEYHNWVKVLLWLQ